MSDQQTREVPVDMTDDMCLALRNLLREDEDASCYDMWRVLLAAAPTPAAANEGADREDACETINLYAAGCACLPMCSPHKIIRGYHKKLCDSERRAAQAERQLADRGAATVAWVKSEIEWCEKNGGSTDVAANGWADGYTTAMKDVLARLLTQPEGAAVGGGAK